MTRQLRLMTSFCLHQIESAHVNRSSLFCDGTFFLMSTKARRQPDGSPCNVMGGLNECQEMGFNLISINHIQCIPLQVRPQDQDERDPARRPLLCQRHRPLRQRGLPPGQRPGPHEGPQVPLEGVQKGSDRGPPQDTGLPRQSGRHRQG